MHCLCVVIEGRGVGTQTGYGKMKMDVSPQPDHHQPVFDHAYYATTPPSSSPEDGGTINI